MGMFDYIRVEGTEVPGIDLKRLEEAQGPVRKFTEVDGVEVYEDGDLGGHKAAFQTKALERSLSTFVIKGGRLFGRIYEWEEVPEEERPYFGRPQWERGNPELIERTRRRIGRAPSWVYSPGYYREIGSMRVAGHKDVDRNYYGDLPFHGLGERICVEEERGAGLVDFLARFAGGDLLGIERLR